MAGVEKLLACKATVSS